MRSVGVSFHVAALAAFSTWANDFIPTMADVMAELAKVHAIANCIKSLHNF